MNLHYKFFLSRCSLHLISSTKETRWKKNKINYIKLSHTNGSNCAVSHMHEQIWAIQIDTNVVQLNYFPSSVSNYETVIKGGYRSMCNGVVYFQSKSRLSYFDGSTLSFQLRKRNHIEHYVLWLEFFPCAIAVASFVSLSLTGFSLNWIIVMLH